MYSVWSNSRGTPRFRRDGQRQTMVSTDLQVMQLVSPMVKPSSLALRRGIMQPQPTSSWWPTGAANSVDSEQESQGVPTCRRALLRAAARLPDRAAALSGRG